MFPSSLGRLVASERYRLKAGCVQSVGALHSEMDALHRRVVLFCREAKDRLAPAMCDSQACSCRSELKLVVDMHRSASGNYNAVYTLLGYKRPERSARGAVPDAEVDVPLGLCDTHPWSLAVAKYSEGHAIQLEGLLKSAYAAYLADVQARFRELGRVSRSSHDSVSCCRIVFMFVYNRCSRLCFRPPCCAAF